MLRLPKSGLPTLANRQFDNANESVIRSKILLSTRQHQPSQPRGDDRERIIKARQAAEALFTSQPPVSRPSDPDSPPADQSARKPRVLAIAPVASVRPEEREMSAAPVPQNDARDRAVAIWPHPRLGEIRHDGRPGRQGLRGCRRRDCPDFAAGLIAIRPCDHSAGIGLRRNPQPEGRQSTGSDARQNEPYSSTQMSVRGGRPWLSGPVARLSLDALAKMPTLQR